MSDHKPPPAGESAKGTSTSDSRRRFTRAGLSAPVIMTLASRPVWARNCSESGVLSGNLSEPTAPPCGGEGCSPGYWKNHTSQWHYNYPPSMPFSAAFGVDAFPGATLHQVMSEVHNKQPNTQINSPCDQCEEAVRQLGFHAVAALQNAATGVSFDLSVSEVINSFNMAYGSADKNQMEITKSSLDTLNNQGCPF